jgi:hypothetical protein
MSMLMPPLHESAKKVTLPVKALAILIATVFVGWLYVFAYDHFRIVQLDHLFDPVYGYPLGYREAYFARRFASYGEIEDYLSDVTLVISHPPRGNAIYYFDRNQQFALWREPVVATGRWWTDPELQLLKLGSERRFAIVQYFCMSRASLIEDAQDNCYSVADVDSLINAGAGGRIERSKGNVFNLTPGKRQPFSLPHSDLSTAALLERVTDIRR